VNWLKLVLGLLLLVVAARQWRSRPKEGDTPAVPKWMDTIDSFTAAKSAGTAFLLAGINPKNLLLVIGGATAIAQTEISGGEQVVALVVFIVIASAGVATPLVIFFAMGDRAATTLERLKNWMAKENAVIMAVLCLIIGVKLIGDAISGFSA